MGIVPPVHDNDGVPAQHLEPCGPGGVPKALAERFYTVTPDNPRAMKADVLAGRIAAMGAEAIPCGSVAEGVQAAMDYAGKDGVCCALGSLYMSGDVRACFSETSSQGK